VPVHTKTLKFEAYTGGPPSYHMSAFSPLRGATKALHFKLLIIIIIIASRLSNLRNVERTDLCATIKALRRSKNISAYVEISKGQEKKEWKVPSPG
jgi:hypothetical protein